MTTEEAQDMFGGRKATMACLAAGALLVAGGCATTGSAGGDSGDRSVITRSEIEEADPSTLYELVSRVRPNWLQTRLRSVNRESEIVVIRSGTVLGDVSVLRQFGPSGVERLRFEEGDQARTLVGARSGYVVGAIIIERTGDS